MIAIPPLVLLLEVGVRMVGSSFVTFTDARGTMDPGSDCSGMLHLLSSIESVCIYGLLDLEILLDIDETFFHAALRSELQDLKVACLSVALDILASGLDSELPGSFKVGLLLEAVVRRSIILFYYYKVSAIVVFFEGCKSLLLILWIDEEELDMDSALSTLLKLAVDIGATCVKPSFEIGFDRSSVWVVQSAQPRGSLLTWH